MPEFGFNTMELCFILGAFVLTIPILYLVKKVSAELKKKDDPS